jgi:hypothetical protein
MATRTQGRRGATRSGQGSAVELWAAGRLPFLDNLKVLLVAGIIAGHAVAGYTDARFWPYAEMNEVELSPATQAVLMGVVAPATLLMIPVLFLVAGLFTPRSLRLHGPRQFAVGRLLRLGVPFAAYVAVVQPLLMYPVHPPDQSPGSFWYELVGAGDRTLDTGPLWFVGVLLVFSLCYAAYAAALEHRAPPPRARMPRRLNLFGLAAAVAVATYLVRTQVPLDGSNPAVSLDVWEWPGCAAAFGLGIVGSARDWLAGLPEPLHRTCRRATLAALAGFALLTVVIVVLGLDGDRLWGGWGWPALVFASLESVVVVFGSLWVFSAAQRHLDGLHRWAGPRVSRSAYGAFVLQTVFLIGIAFALRPLQLTAEMKAVLLAVSAVVCSFTLAWVLVSRVPGLRRVL